MPAFTRSQMRDQEFFETHRDEIMEALKAGRVVDDLTPSRAPTQAVADLLTDADLAAIEAAKVRYEINLKFYRGDDRTTSEAKTADIAAAYENVRNEIDAVVERRRQRVDNEVSRLRQGLFTARGLQNDVHPLDPAVTVSYRDATDRVQNLGPDDAAKLLERAVTTGDRPLQRAVFTRAYDASAPGIDPTQVTRHQDFYRSFPDAPAWRQVCDAYLAANPDQAPAAEELTGLLRAQRDPGNVARESSMTVLAAPPELQQ